MARAAESFEVNSLGKPLFNRDGVDESRGLYHPVGNAGDARIMINTDRDRESATSDRPGIVVLSRALPPVAGVPEVVGRLADGLSPLSDRQLSRRSQELRNRLWTDPEDASALALARKWYSSWHVEWTSLRALTDRYCSLQPLLRDKRACDAFRQALRQKFPLVAYPVDASLSAMEILYETEQVDLKVWMTEAMGELPPGQSSISEHPFGRAVETALVLADVIPRLREDKPTETEINTRMLPLNLLTVVFLAYVLGLFMSQALDKFFMGGASSAVRALPKHRVRDFVLMHRRWKREMDLSVDWIKSHWPDATIGRDIGELYERAVSEHV